MSSKTAGTLTRRKNLKRWTSEMIIIIVLKIKQFGSTMQYCFQMMQREWQTMHCVQMMRRELQTMQTLLRLFLQEQSDLGLHCLLTAFCPNTYNFYSIYHIPEVLVLSFLPLLSAVSSFLPSFFSLPFFSSHMLV